MRQCLTQTQQLKKEQPLTDPRDLRPAMWTKKMTILILPISPMSLPSYEEADVFDDEKLRCSPHGDKHTTRLKRLQPETEPAFMQTYSPYNEIY